jgi:ABC-type polysaccharide/polyol phosphate transport system ATPase subunit
LADLVAHLPQAKIIVTHDISFAASLCQRAVFFDSGTVAAEGTVGDVVSRFDWDFSAPRSKLRP